MIDCDVIVTISRNVVESFGELKIQGKLKRVVYHSLMIFFYFLHVVIIVKPNPLITLQYLMTLPCTF